MLSCNYIQRKYTKSIGAQQNWLVSFYQIGRSDIIVSFLYIVLIIVLLTRSIRRYLMISRRDHVIEHIISGKV